MFVPNPTFIDKPNLFRSRSRSRWGFERRPNSAKSLPSLVTILFICLALPWCSGVNLYFEPEKHTGFYDTFKSHLLKPQDKKHDANYGKGFHNRDNARNSDVDPDANKNLTQLITSSGYPVEVYTVQTVDGFLLDLHRIPHGRAGPAQSRGVVFLQHALLSSACDWVMNFANDSLGFILADNGYDVWMGNTRGNTYSRRHISLSPDDAKFWDWSIDEMAQYDMPAFIDFVLKKTGQPSLSLIGHSQGTMMNFALLSERPDMEEKVNVFIALAPVAFVGNIVSPIGYLSYMTDEELYTHCGNKIFLPNDLLIKALVDLFCTEKAYEWICEDILFLFVGIDLRNLNQSRLDVYFHHSPSGVSVKDIVHFAQLYRQKNFGKYDYGSPEKNMARYNQSTPPQYDVTKIKVPVVAFSASRDWLADPTVSSFLSTQLLPFDLRHFNNFL
ncbi:lipase [Elysia marginata]|uniref:Lipase n=1 Tax=Elysia marginata TaxID=1093978 RepID=A0AAV4GL78_9GAST|nr:lipase [Elysia marginata]